MPFFLVFVIINIDFTTLRGGIPLKKILFLIFLFCSILSFSEENLDFKRFSRGKEYYESGQYNYAKLEFESLIRNFPNSLLFENNYANYYIGVNYYYLKDFTKARYYLEKAIYLPKEFRNKGGYFKKHKSHFFEYRRNFYLAKTLEELGNINEANKTYKFLIKDYYDPNLAPFEIKALKKLASADPYYGIIYKVKYEGDMSILSSIKDEDLIGIGDFFMSKGVYSNAVLSYDRIGKRDHSINLKMLEALTRAKRYDDVIRITSNFIEDYTYKPLGDMYCYRGNAYRRKGLVAKALENFNLVNEGKFKVSATFSKARMYYLQGNYDMTISILKGINTSSAHLLLNDSYLAANMYDEFKTSAINYIKRYPYNDEAAYYRYLLYKEEGNKNYLKWIQKYNLNSYYYEVAREVLGETRDLREYPIEYKLKEYKHIVTDLDELSKLNDPELLKMNFENLKLNDGDKAFEGALISMVYEEGGFYHEALKNSINYRVSLSNYSNLVELIYPRYYSHLIKAAADKYNVEEALIYAVIKQESLFNEGIVSRSAAYGLMQITLPTARGMSQDITVKELSTPSANIDLGTRYLRKLLDVYEGDITKVIAAYNGGMGNVRKWTDGNTKDLDIETIPFLETRNYTKKVINNYYKYKRFYY